MQQSRPRTPGWHIHLVGISSYFSTGAALNGHLNQISAALFTVELLTTRNYDGITPIRAAERSGHILQIPEALRPKPPGLLRRLLQRIGATRAPWE
jgi:hypothetical protein